MYTLNYLLIVSVMLHHYVVVSNNAETLTQNTVYGEQMYKTVVFQSWEREH